MIRKIMYSGLVKSILRIFFSLFYDKKYLRGYFFDEKRMGWYWAWKGLKARKLGFGTNIPWPVCPGTIVSHPDNIDFDVDNINLFQSPGCYWQNHDGKIVIGKGSYVAPNVGFITTNHDVYDLSKHVEGKDIVLGKGCWVGMNAVLLPGVHLGDHTVVAAGGVVTQSFPDGYCVVGGVPAKEIKKLEKNKFLDNQGENIIKDEFGGPN